MNRPFRPSQAPYAVLLGLDSITGLQSARILASCGVPVLALARSPNHYACRTRACRKILLADTRTEELIERLVELGPRLDRPAVLFPCTDLAVLLVSRCRDRLARWYRVALGEPQVVEMLLDKVRFHRFARQAGLNVPHGLPLRCPEDCERAAAQLRFPCLVKPAVKTARWQEQTKDKLLRVESGDQLVEAYVRCSRWADELTVQEWIPGADSQLYTGMAYFDARYEPRALLVSRKVRQWPPGTGIGCFARQCHDDQVQSAVLRLFQAARYRGLGYLELKKDPRDGTLFAIEANVGRPTGRSAMAEAAGHPLLLTQYCDALGWELPASSRRPCNRVCWIHLRQDVRSALAQWRAKKLSLGQWLCSYTSGRWCFAVWSAVDSAPFWTDLSGQLQTALISGLRQRFRRQMHRAWGGTTRFTRRQSDPSAGAGPGPCHSSDACGMAAQHFYPREG